MLGHLERCYLECELVNGFSYSHGNNKTSVLQADLGARWILVSFTNVFSFGFNRKIIFLYLLLIYFQQEYKQQ